MLKKSPYEILVIYKGHCVYSCPKSFSQTSYSGTLIEIITDTSRVIVKPSTKLLVDFKDQKASTLYEGQRLNRFFSFQTVDKKDHVLWTGNILCLFFGEEVLLPVKFENDYILIPT
jgi:hypothetical protein